MGTWKLEDARNRFSELVRLARSEAPQRVTRHGRDAVVIMSAEEYDALMSPPGLVEFLQGSPLAEALSDLDAELDLSRPRDFERDVELA